MHIHQVSTFDRDKEKISFIITYHNLPTYMLCECIDSILCLSLKPSQREIIIVDDGSKISPIDNIQKYGKDIIYIYKHNEGLSSARNTGMQMATGTYIQFIDADDSLIKVPYEHCLDIVRFNTPDMVLFNRTNDKTKYNIAEIKGVVSGTEYMLHNNIRAAAWGYIFKKKIVGKIQFPNGHLHEDEEFTPQLLLKAEEIYYTNTEAYFYRQRNGSIMSNKNIKHIIIRLADMERVIYKLHKSADRLTPLDKDAMQRRVAQLTMDYIYNIIILTHSTHQLEKRIKRLYNKGLFPLPDKEYTQKYKWFRILTLTPIGRKILCKTCI